MKYDFRFDVLRDIGLLFILLCHFVTRFDSRFASEIHDILAGGGNFIFFIISGWLLGMKWRAKGCPAYGVAFLLHCGRRIYFPLWSFLIPFSIWMLIYNGVGLVKLLMNFVGLSWLFKIDGFGHFWYITLILAFYFVIFLLTNMRLAVVSGKPLMALPIIFCGILVKLLMACVGIRQNYIMVFLTIGLLFFIYGDKILSVLEKFWKVVVPVSLVSLGVFCFVMVIMHDKECFGVRSWLQAGIGASVIAIVMPWLKMDWRVRFIGWIAGISFDVYIVHCLFRNVSLSRNDLINFHLYILLSFATAMVLRWYRAGIERLLGIRKKKN